MACLASSQTRHGCCTPSFPGVCHPAQATHGSHPASRWKVSWCSVSLGLAVSQNQAAVGLQQEVVACRLSAVLYSFACRWLSQYPGDKAVSDSSIQELFKQDFKSFSDLGHTTICPHKTDAYSFCETVNRNNLNSIES